MATLCHACDGIFQFSIKPDDTFGISTTTFIDRLRGPGHIFLKLMYWNNMKPHHPSLKSMQKAARIGCCFCKVLREEWNGLTEFSVRHSAHASVPRPDLRNGNRWREFMA